MSSPTQQSVLDDALLGLRRDERRRLADLLAAHRQALTSFVASPEKMLDLVVMLLRLDDAGLRDGRAATAEAHVRRSLVDKTLIAAAEDMLSLGAHEGDCTAPGGLGGDCEAHRQAAMRRASVLSKALEAYR